MSTIKTVIAFNVIFWGLPWVLAAAQNVGAWMAS